MADKKYSTRDKMTWKPGDVTVTEKYYQGKKVDKFPWEKGAPADKSTTRKPTTANKKK